MPNFGTKHQYERWIRVDSKAEAMRSANSLEHQTGQLTLVRKVPRHRKWDVYATIAHGLSHLAREPKKASYYLR